MVTRRQIPARRSASTTRAPGGRRAQRRRRFPVPGRLALGGIGLVAVLLTCVALLTGGMGSPASILVQQDAAPPTRLSATPLSPTSVTLQWRSSQQADRYVVRVAGNRSLTQDIIEVEAGTTEVTLSDLPATTPGSDQYFRVDAVRDGKVTSSRTGRFVLPPGEIGEVEARKVSADGVRLTWEAVDNARQYDVEVAKDEEFTEGVAAARTVSSKPELITTSLAAETTYWFRVRPVNGDVRGELSEPVKVKTRPAEVAFNVGTWNVCSEKCKGYEGRARIMADFLNANELDMFGLQEAGGQRVGPTTARIFSGGERGFALATGGAKARYIFYRPELFEQQSGGFFAVGHGRHATWARFTVKKTGREFFFVDVHLENGKSGAANAKRSSEMQSMLGQMASINDGGLPIVYAGDFNSGKHRSADAPGALARGAGLSDTVDLASNPENREFNTGHTFSTTPLRSGAHVDHIFTSEEFTVKGWTQLVRMNGRSYASPVVSDHNALRARIALDAEKVDVGEPTAIIDVPPVTQKPSVTDVTE